MTITFKAKKKKVEKRLVWHKTFVIFPKRVRQDQLQFLTYVGRRLMPRYNPNTPMWAQYEYKNLQDIITEKLMDK